MRSLAVVLILSALLTPVVAQQNLRASAKKPEAKAAAEPPTNCSMATHTHRYEDMRLAMVEVTSDDDCGFSYNNLESNTTGPDNHFQYGQGFLVARTSDYKSNAPLIQSDVLTRKAIHQGTRGIAVYCEACRVIMMFKIVKGE
ncbi:MAG: hypothetical protein ACJ74J_17140 [Blastocatellia bacterium]